MTTAGDKEGKMVIRSSPLKRKVIVVKKPPIAKKRGAQRNSNTNGSQGNQTGGSRGPGDKGTMEEGRSRSTARQDVR